MVVLVTGANGQLGQALQFIAGDYPEVKFHFCGSSDLDITRVDSIKAAIFSIKPDFCVNAAAYTAVDKAETDLENAYQINVLGVKNLASICKELDVALIHISTDFVFDGDGQTPYKENDVPNPQGVYGSTKLEGESEIRKILKDHFIIRTSWVYSQFGNNFMKTMLRISNEKKSLNVVDDQIGTPTHAIDLAKAIVKIFLSKSQNFGTYHFSNEGSVSWCGFARKIYEVYNVNMEVNAIPTSEFPTPARRPKYSVLDKSKIKSEFGLEISSWDTALEKYK